MAYKASGIMPGQLENEPDIPELTQHLWHYFLDLHAERTGNGMGPNPLTSSQILHWSLLAKTRLDLWEIRALKRIDQAWMESQ